jgi:molybdopterin-guanine dinucleotide biosynthesis protein A
MSYIALAGGKSLRLGRSKVSEIIDDGSLLERVIGCLSLFKGEIIVVKAREQSLPQLNKYSKLRVVTDIYPDKGPLGGIYTGLAESNSSHSLVVAGDMPFLNRALLQYMIKISPKFDLVVPRLGDMVEPLHAVYSKNCLASIENLIEQNNLMVTRLFDLLKVRYIEADEIDRFDPQHLSFFNVNTEADLEKARKIIREEKHDKC